MSKLYCFEHGYCRGEPFGTKRSVDVDFVVKTLVSAMQFNLKEGGDEDAEDFINKACTEYKGKRDFELEEVLFALFSGEGWMDYPRSPEAIKDLDERVEKIKKGEKFHIEQEEGTWGFGTSPDEAKLAYAEADVDGDNEDDWD